MILWPSPTEPSLDPPLPTHCGACEDCEVGCPWEDEHTDCIDHREDEP